MMLRRQLARLWRRFATVLSFALFGLGGVLVPLVAVPVLYLLPGDRHTRERRARRLVHWLFKFFIHFMRCLGLLNWRVSGLDKLQRPGTLILANHPTLLDVVFLIAFVPDANCIVKSRLTSNPAMRGIIAITGYLPNDSGPQLIDSARHALHSGSAVIIFPEGTRTRPGHEMVFQRGAANIATRCGVDITPVVIDCSPPTLSKEHMWYHIPPEPFTMSFDVKDDIAIAPYISDPASLSARQLTRDVELLFTIEVNANAEKRTKKPHY